MERRRDGDSDSEYRISEQEDEEEDDDDLKSEDEADVLRSANAFLSQSVPGRVEAATREDTPVSSDAEKNELDFEAELRALREFLGAAYQQVRV